MKNLKSRKVKSKQFGTPNKFDVNGSYTGTPNFNNINEKPIQDADDL